MSKSDFLKVIANQTERPKRLIRGQLHLLKNIVINHDRGQHSVGRYIDIF